ncbi:hypothetical protein SAMD00019534_014960 [Acytostelium subglobosum LB1]|uniref:hypothetical protein n=1 Tax=Acytostelium subglobosum LB1 TaxID=1410327 RepID=UPI000644F130|nr:hypothetical protein SAMD00019534_014960 [Acytostelium subglobosum LB1]GAM18321.1 hypothetical protein SAMD00019534_014960 [Acytostelium subglobosum LB1]|eukprot:XP_012757541.1 hypothetical protein SAMD00019534_014960 [Acytostelium subglobosum LB1]
MLSPYCCLKQLRSLIIINMNKNDTQLMLANHQLFFQHLESLTWSTDEHLSLSFFKDVVVDHPSAQSIPIRYLKLTFKDHKDAILPLLSKCIQSLQLEYLSINYCQQSEAKHTPQCHNAQALTSLALGNDNSSIEWERCTLSDPGEFIQSLRAIDTLRHLALFPTNAKHEYQPALFDQYLSTNHSLTSLSLPFVGHRPYLELIACKLNLKRLQIEMDDDVVFPFIRSLRLSSTKDMNIYHQLCAIKRAAHAEGQLMLQHLHLKYKECPFLHCLADNTVIIH